MTRAAITFDTGALIGLEWRKDRAMKIYAHAKDWGFVVATLNVTVAEWWRGRSDRREAVWRGLLVEPPSDGRRAGRREHCCFSKDAGRAVGPTAKQPLAVP
jgi:hypothetical protein